MSDTDIYDYVTADTLGDEPNEQIVFQNDYIELSRVEKTDGGVIVHGYSHISGDNVFYILHPDQEVGLWTV
jgi:hypothetical protein